MAKSSVQRDDVRTRDIDTRLNNNTIAAMWAGGSLMVSIVVLTALGGTGLYFGRDHGGVQGAKLGLLLGLMVGVIVLGLLLKVNSVRLRARSDNLYRGLWAGLILAVILLLLMAFAPELLGATPPPATDPTSR
jgi:uncharacterized membrane protein